MSTTSTKHTVTKSESAITKNSLGWAGIAAFIGCAACCALPMLTVALVGTGASTTISRLFKPGSELVVGALVFALTFGILMLRARATRRGCSPTCKLDGTCCERGTKIENPG